MPSCRETKPEKKGQQKCPCQYLHAERVKQWPEDIAEIHTASFQQHLRDIAIHHHRRNL